MVVLVVLGARKLGHISCGNGVIASPIIPAIRVGGLQKSGNKASRLADGHPQEGIQRWLETHPTHTNTWISSKTTHLPDLFADVTGNSSNKLRGISQGWRRVFRRAHVMDPCTQIYVDAWSKRDDGRSCGFDLIVWTVKMLFGVVVAMLRTAKHTNMCSGIFSHIHACSSPKTHTHTEHIPQRKLSQTHYTLHLDCVTDRPDPRGQFNLWP